VGAVFYLFILYIFLIRAKNNHARVAPQVFNGKGGLHNFCSLKVNRAGFYTSIW